MKNLINHIFLLPFLFCTSIHAQVTSGNTASSTEKSAELPVVTVVAAKSPEVYKADNITKREKFYAPKPNFDAANQYDSLFEKSANAGFNKKSEKGVVKLMNDNNNTPMVYYNNASTGTILKLTNPENGKSAYVVVVGKIPPTESSSFLLKISDMVVRKLCIKEYDSVELVFYIQSPGDAALSGGCPIGDQYRR